MPRYFFLLSFGNRVHADEEGVELPNRAAARDEAVAVVRDLAKPDAEGGPRRWAGWFLEVADESASFFRTAIGHPALEVVRSDGHSPRVEVLEPDAARPATTAAPKPRCAGLLRQMWERRQQTEQLLR